MNDRIAVADLVLRETAAMDLRRDATARVVRTSGRVTGATTIALLRMPPVATDAPAPPVADGDSGGEEE